MRYSTYDATGDHHGTFADNEVEVEESDHGEFVVYNRENDLDDITTNISSS